MLPVMMQMQPLALQAAALIADQQTDRLTGSSLTSYSTGSLKYFLLSSFCSRQGTCELGSWWLTKHAEAGAVPNRFQPDEMHCSQRQADRAHMPAAGLSPPGGA